MPPGADVKPEASPPPAPEVVSLSLSSLDEDASFRMRQDAGDFSALAMDVARLGQLFPIDVRPRGEGRYQLVCGHRRVAALKFLQRDSVMARVHRDLSDESALLMALASGIHSAPLSIDDLEALKARLASEGRLVPAVKDMLEKAITADSLSPEHVEEEVDADELAIDITLRLSELNQDLAVLADVFSSLDDGRKEELLRQLGYSSDLVAFLEGR